MTTIAENSRRVRIAAFLYDKGATFQEIAELLEVSKQMAKNYVQPDRFKARVSVNKAVAAGGVHKPDICQKCGRTGQRLHGHHDDYNDTYGVRWLCPRCHVRIHPGERKPATA